MATRRPFWKWHRWKSIGFCLWPPSICIWNLKLKFQSKLDLCSGNHVVYRQTDRRTDGRTDGRTRWIQYTPPLTSLGRGMNSVHPHELLPGVSHLVNSGICNTTTTTWGPPGADRTQVGPMLSLWTLLSGLFSLDQPIVSFTTLF